MTDLELIESGLKLYFVKNHEIVRIINNSRANEKRYISLARVDDQLSLLTMRSMNGGSGCGRK